MIFVLHFFFYLCRSYQPGIISSLYKSGKVSVFSSGSGKIWADEDWHQTKAENAIDPNYGKNQPHYGYDWCSSCNETLEDTPSIGIEFLNSYIRVEKYVIRNACVENGCYCQETYCCSLYSWELQGSVDNSTWNTLHRVNGERLYPCEEKVYSLDGKKGLYSFYKLVHVGSLPGCWSCFTFNKLEFYGEITDDNLENRIAQDLYENEDYEYDDGTNSTKTIGKKREEDDDDTIIIGRKKIVNK